MSGRTRPYGHQDSGGGKKDCRPAHSHRHGLGACLGYLRTGGLCADGRDTVQPETLVTLRPATRVTVFLLCSSCAARSGSTGGTVAGDRCWSCARSAISSRNVIHRHPGQPAPAQCAAPLWQDRQVKPAEPHRPVAIVAASNRPASGLILKLFICLDPLVPDFGS